MKTTPVTGEDLRGVFAVPPLARRNDARRTLDFDANDAIVRYIANGGITRFLYGGNAFVHHLTLAEYQQMIEWLSDLSGELWTIPSAGPSFGRTMDQAPLLKRYKYPCVMMLPCADPRDAAGLERGYTEFAEAADARLIVYLKEENSFGANREVGLDAVARLVESGICVGIKYAVVRTDPAQDVYLEALLQRVDRRFVVSGIGERPAVNHLRDWRLPGFTTGSGCLAPRLSQMIFDACIKGDYELAEKMRAAFIPHEDLRDDWHPAKVLHFAVELSGIAATGPVPPFLSMLSAQQQDTLTTVARTLAAQNQLYRIKL
ncbi:MAG: dihydrodipicolinate synthase family protein [Pyrinomonadaceae bacterium]